MSECGMSLKGAGAQQRKGDNTMPRRGRPIPRGKSRRSFSKHADKTHRKNLPAPRKMPMRGGIRM